MAFNVFEHKHLQFNMSISIHSPLPLTALFPLPSAELILCAVILYEYCRRRTST